MKRVILVYLFCLAAISHNYGQAKDTLRIVTESEKGYGPFNKSLSFIGEHAAPELFTEYLPEIKELPANLDNIITGYIVADEYQLGWQLYKTGVLAEKAFIPFKLGWKLDPVKDNLYDKPLRVYFPLAAGYNNNGELAVYVDRNGDGNLTGEKPYIIPPKKAGEEFRFRCYDITPIDVTYEYYDGKTVRKAITALYIDIDPVLYEKWNGNPGTPALCYDFCEYKRTDIPTADTKFVLFLKGERAVYRKKLKLILVETGLENEKDCLRAYPDNIVVISNKFYRIEDLSPAGDNFKLVETTEGNLAGMQAPGFTLPSIDGDVISLSALKGNYVLIDFWGTWCGPCRKDIPNLKKLNDKYGGKNFRIIGIAKDSRNKVKEFVIKNNIPWAQAILPENDDNINKYEITAYPTTFLIDPAGKIIFKNFGSEGVEEVLKKAFEK